MDNVDVEGSARGGVVKLPGMKPKSGTLAYWRTDRLDAAVSDLRQTVETTVGDLVSWRPGASS